MRKLLLNILLLFLILPSAIAQKRFSEPAIAATGAASFYADNLHGRRTSSGEPYDRNALTAAHKTLPFGSRVKITNPKNGKEVIVRINDRGPHRAGRAIDLSKAAAKKLGMDPKGCPMVCMEVLGDIRFRIDSAQADSLTGGTFLAKAGTLSGRSKPAALTGYGLQVSAFHTLENAASEIQAIQEAGFEDVFLQVTHKAGSVLYRVLVGNFDSRAKALLNKQELVQAGFAAIPVKHF